MKRWTQHMHPTQFYWSYLDINNSLRPRQNGRLFADDTFKRIFLNENITISIKKFVPKGLINNIPALVLIMAWRRPGDKPLSEPMLVRSLTHICVTRPQWDNLLYCWQRMVHVFVRKLDHHWFRLRLVASNYQYSHLEPTYEHIPVKFQSK